MNNSSHTLNEALTTQTEMRDDSSSLHASTSSFKERIIVGANSSKGLSKEENNARILAKRGVFRWLPVGFDNDIVYGSWYFVWGSFLCILIPIVPLVSIYAKVWGDDDTAPEDLPVGENTACYGLLIFIGVMYTVGSYAFLLASKEPSVPAIFGGQHPSGLPFFYHFQTDELFGLWCFFLGTVPFVPIIGIFSAYAEGEQKEHLSIALVVSIVFSILFFGGIVSVYPSQIQQHNHELNSKLETQSEESARPLWLVLFCPCLNFSPNKQILVPMCRCMIPSKYHNHIETDWLIVCWLMYISCLLTTILTLGLLFEGIARNDFKDIYDYSTGFVDLVLFTVASMYFVAGSYGSKEVEVTA